MPFVVQVLLFYKKCIYYRLSCCTLQHCTHNYPAQMKWSYKQDAQQLGPVDKEELLRLVDEKVINRRTLVWREGMADWKPMSAIPSLVAALQGDNTPLPEQPNQNLFNPWAEQYDTDRPTENEIEVVRCPTCSEEVDPKCLVAYRGDAICLSCYEQKEASHNEVEAVAATKDALPAGIFRLMGQALSRLMGHWCKSILFSYMFILVMCVLSPFLIFIGPLLVGKNAFWLAIAQDENPQWGSLFKGFANFFKSLSTFAVGVFILFASFALVGVVAYFIAPEMLAALPATQPIELKSLTVMSLDLRTFSFSSLALPSINLPNIRLEDYLSQNNLILAALLVAWALITTNLALRYSQLFAILAHKPALSTYRTFAKSNRLMRRRKIKFVSLLLCLIVVGIAVIMLAFTALLYLPIPAHLYPLIQIATLAGICSILYPFMSTTLACFYNDLDNGR